ncbi:MAG: rhamnan synthesis F family protein, partial [Actinomyces sp.]
AHLYYMDLLEPTLAYVKSMPEGTDLILTVGSQEKAELVEEACKDLPYNVTVRLIENRGRDVSALLVGCKDIINDYDLVCFTHDKKVTQVRPYSVGDGFAIKCFENLLATRDFVKNVIATFDAEPRLGLLAPTPPNHGDYFPVFTMGWGPNFERTKTLVKDELNLNVPMDESKLPIAPLGTMFWFRPAALKPLFDHDWTWEEFPPEPNNIDGTILHAIERAYGYVAQASGYFCGWLFSDSFARIEITSLSHYVQDFTYAVAENGILGYEDDMVSNLFRRGVELRRLKKKAERWIPRPLHKPLLKAFQRARGIGR